MGHSEVSVNNYQTKISLIPRRKPEVTQVADGVGLTGIYKITHFFLAIGPDELWVQVGHHVGHHWFGVLKDRTVAMLLLRTTEMFEYSVRRRLDKMIRSIGCSKNSALLKFVSLISTIRQSVCVLCSYSTKFEQCGLREVIMCKYVRRTGFTILVAK